MSDPAEDVTRRIEAIVQDEPFDVATTALTAVLAGRLVSQASDIKHLFNGVMLVSENLCECAVRAYMRLHRGGKRHGNTTH